MNGLIVQFMKNKVGDANSDRRYESADRHEVIPLGEFAGPTGLWVICGHIFFLLPEDGLGNK